MDGSVLVYLCDARTVCPDTLASLVSRLTPDESVRFRSFVRQERQRQFVIGRALAWAAAASLLAVESHLVELEFVPAQGPRVGRPAPLPGLSISHSGPWVGCAASRQTQVGFDIEVMDPRRDVEELARQAFGDHAAFLLAMPPQQRILAFYRMWTEHEARIKLGVPGSVLSLERDGLSITLAHADQRPPHANLTVVDLKSLLEV